MIDSSEGLIEGELDRHRRHRHAARELGNTEDGVLIGGSSRTIGGTAAGTSNVISANS